jgi:uncharacterized membrane protein
MDLGSAFHSFAEAAYKLVEAFGVLVIVVGIVYATILAFSHHFGSGPGAFEAYRVRLARAILLGLEFLLAGDIIRTVVVETTLESVVVLALIALVRTFLSFTLQLEVDGRWPWQQRQASTASPPGDAADGGAATARR